MRLLTNAVSKPSLKSLLLTLLLVTAALQEGCATKQASDAPVFDSTPRLAVLSAFEPELDQLRQATKIQHVRVINGRSYYLGRLSGQNVVLLLSGYSMVNASMTAQTLVDHFNVNQLVFSGIAGGVNPNLKVGDVTVPAQWGQYQEQAFAKETAAGWDPGRFKGPFTNYGMMFPREVSVVQRGEVPDRQESKFWFATDARGLEIVKRVASSIKLNRCTDNGDCLDAEPRVVVGGSGVSGQTFVDNAAYRQYVWETFHADALDMETAAVATVAYVHRVPFIAFRSLSELAGGGKGKNEADTFFKLAADNSAAVVLAYVKALGEANSTHSSPPVHSAQ